MSGLVKESHAKAFLRPEILHVRRAAQNRKKHAGLTVVVSVFSLMSNAMKLQRIARYEWNSITRTLSRNL